MTTAARRLAPTRPWADLPPELLTDISGHLHDTADFVRFHAVSLASRVVAPAPSQTTTSSFLPWLLASCQGQILHSVVKFSGRRIISDSSEATAGYTYNDVASAHATAGWFFTPRPEPVLEHLFNGAVIRLPRLPDDDGNGTITQLMENAHVIVYGDGTVLLYHLICSDTGRIWGHLPDDTTVFVAAVRRPGDAAWTVVKERLDAYPVPHGRVVAAYHDGRVLACACWLFWWGSLCLPVPVQGQEDDRVVMLVPPWDASKQRECDREDSYLLESRGELIWASVLVERDWRRRYDAGGDTTLPASAMHVIVHALEGPDGRGRRMRWAARDGRSLLGDRVLFLGYPASFALDAAPRGVPGGCAYFVFESGVYRYGFDDGEAKLVQRLRPGWGADGMCVWLQPQPAIAPIEEIRERLAEVSKEEQLNSGRT
ncbi:LOW QUALITY PROTEIN: hypothetical protein BRADI_4g38173v3 [Brachypodium distachyon]|uniref:KIB1-4 beta-propeller domain-containing protein n=1 Tax=Brachypodium distachyon TaxID=15368 RepID=A0A0Q3LFN2_BRADI|nr:LOW QUALITY PROTEIN: hypothetical protein BRADI_4g38173v3 [Brachypodium distachyon]